MNRKIVKISSAAILLIIALGAWLSWNAVWASNVTTDGDHAYLYVPTGSGYDEVFSKLKDQNLLKHPPAFDKVASLMKYKKTVVPPGRYKIENGWSNRKLISKLRSGAQDALFVVINNNRIIQDLAGNAARFLESDSLSFLNYFMETETLEKFGYNRDNFMTMFIPNSYEMFWTTSPEKFTQRMQKEHGKFWTAERLSKISANGLDPIQAYIVASIVEKESNYEPERPAIAGVYINRLKQGMKLQADPTVVFATGQFELRRVLYSHLDTDSPYNTYRYGGLPPGPICMPSLSSLEAVINAEDHDYIFFCAKADNSGQHAFARTLSEHNKNAAAFSNWLNANKIR